MSRDFELSAKERGILADHLVYDRSYAPPHLLRHHLREDVWGGTDPGTVLHAWAGGRRPAGIPPDFTAVIDRHAVHAVVLDDLHRRLLTRSKRTAFPAAALRRALTGASTPRR
ncbi:hypothetical protein [Streptomyces longisporus]|uniref:Uncharacterized protein n=1 Tax=Streptomyces longisporus TaxID=1948 RepID=A0ABN3NHA9_STRLO